MIDLVCDYSPTQEHEGSDSLCEFCLEYVDATDGPCPGMGIPSPARQPNGHSTRPDLSVWCLEYDVVRA